ncbi:hypothetical protein YbgI [Vibrio maritimus]|uniref:Uncharacterized protein n=1 Tax=Vibrio maritimus TaxID=990268 RepID=A0A090S4I0_9VIBR|nr:hypothetical protein YbgI [Vibrio maritimus]
MNNLKLEAILNEKLSPQLIKDYSPNGLQVEGASEIKKVITGVTASQALIDYAVSVEADAVLVHHGYFWKGEPEPIRGMKGKRIRTLIKNDVNLFGYHLPLDIHPELGNNARLAELLDIEVIDGLEGHPQSVAMFGKLATPMTGADFAAKIAKTLNREPLHIAPDMADKLIEPLVGVQAVVKITLSLLRQKAWMRLFRERSLSARPTQHANSIFTISLQDIMQPSAMALRRWVNGWLKSMDSTLNLRISIIRFNDEQTKKEQPRLLFCF